MLNKIDPYLRLMRIHNLTGAWLLLWPCLWGLVISSDNIYQLLWAPVFLFGAIVMRSAGCIINDVIDIKLDRQVERTKNRPLARKEITITQAMMLFSSLLLIGFVILLTMGNLSVLLGSIAIILIVIYPFAKYYLKYPQFILGLVFNFGILISSAAIQEKITLAAMLLYIGSFFWIVYYDTIYGHQDKKDDEKVGVNSTALTKIGSKKWLGKFYQTAIILWAFAGVLSKVSILYYLVLSAIAYLLFKQLKNVNLDNKEQCMKAFQFNSNIGFILLVGTFFGKIHEFI
ncbi:MAG: 4-hydroxybenzoate octaprenyltransferase [Rickettsiaceae bacterium H1]|nr:4-hydroxybenzoate octaprenyltransferase [Rickettsiaceae bacterium H1]